MLPPLSVVVGVVELNAVVKGDALRRPLLLVMLVVAGFGLLLQLLGWFGGADCCCCWDVGDGDALFAALAAVVDDFNFAVLLGVVAVWFWATLFRSEEGGCGAVELKCLVSMLTDAHMSVEK